MQEMSENGVILQGEFKKSRKAPGEKMEYNFEMNIDELPLKERF